ncbi:MAG TPA: cohesin domain-containing protein, partial [Bacteroidales bacterium]|nr:cohesin domain-containing protein [Bacteroidales bacterium]
MSKFLLFITFSLFILSSGFSQTDEPKNRINPDASLPSLTADPNSLVNVPVTVNNMNKLQSLTLSFTYDPAILVYDSYSFDGSVLTSTLYNQQVNQVGENTIQFVFTAKSTFFMYTGSGIVGSINFQTGTFGTSPLTFTEFIVNSTTYLGNTVNGEVIITGCLNAIADAGQDVTITTGQLYLLSGAAANNSGVEWTSQGDGFFNNTTILSPYYTPGPQDIANGGTTLCLTAFGFPPCIDDTDCMELTILPEADPQAVLPELFADPGTTVNIPLQINTMVNIQQMSVSYSYDPEVITYLDFNFDGGVLTSGLYNRQFNQLAPGLVQFIFTAKSNQFTFTGSGIVGNVQFTAGNFGISPLVFTEFLVNTNSYLTNVINGQVYISNCINPTAFAGNDNTICEDESASLNGQAFNFESLLWFTTGDGYFSDPSLLNPVYYPGGQDVTSGFVDLCLIAFANSPCLNDTSCLTLTIAELPDVSLLPFEEMCEGEDPIILTGGTPEGGIYYINGEETTIFDPLSAGIYNVLYEYTNEFGCTNSASGEIVVNPLPVVTLEAFPSFCEGDEPFTLTGGAPEGGTYYVNGVITTVFDPSLPGTYSVVYEYTNEFGCTNSASGEIV